MKNQPNKDSVYETSDLSTAAFLKAHGIAFLGQRWEHGTAFFQFSPFHLAQKKSLEYLNDCNVKSSTFVKCIHDLKNLIRKQEEEQ